LTYASKYKSTDEAKVISDCIRNKSKAKEYLFKQYAPYLYTICRRYETNDYQADDCLQDVFIKIFDKIHLFNSNKGTLKSWLSRLTVNHALNKITRQKINWTSLDISSSEIFDLANEEEEAAYQEISEETILNYISQLPLGYRTVFNLYAIEAWPHAEIAQNLNISTSTSKSQLFKARRMLKKMITKKINIRYGV